MNTYKNDGQMDPNFIHPVHNCFDGYFNTNSLMRVDLANPDPFMIRITDIVHALSNLCRFGGHSKQFYSVLQHSMLVAAMAPKEITKEALLHDAAEAYVGDVIKPLKVMLGDVYETIEDKFMQAIIEAFELNPAHLLQVKLYDKIALELEHEAFIKGRQAPLVNTMMDHGLISSPADCAMNPERCRANFILHYGFIFDKIF